MQYLSFMLFLFISMACTSSSEVQRSKYYSQEKEIFIDPNFEGTHKSLWDVLQWKTFSQASPWPKWVEITPTSKIHSPSKPNQIHITFVNHSTFLIQFEGINILTDPIWSERVSPVSWLGPKRVHRPGIRFEDLPPIDLVLISHNHYDHFDSETLKKLADQHDPAFLCPLGDGPRLKALGAKNIFELDWWENLAFNALEVYFTPTQHWSRRGLFDRNKSFWGSYVLNFKGKQVYFAGDTGYSSYFKEIYQNYGKMDIALLPIGAYAPRWFMQDMHMDPEEAIWAHKDLKSKLSIGMHFGSFQLTDEPRKEPVQKLQKFLKSYQINNKDFKTIKPGESLKLDL
jgi:L-ascorbate metabolism protein UlaG (beta-lactamase superfamily)